jgi:hypothetical protein
MGSWENISINQKIKSYSENKRVGHLPKKGGIAYG